MSLCMCACVMFRWVYVCALGMHGYVFLCVGGVGVYEGAFEDNSVVYI